MWTKIVIECQIVVQCFVSLRHFGGDEFRCPSECCLDFHPDAIPSSEREVNPTPAIWGVPEHVVVLLRVIPLPNGVNLRVCAWPEAAIDRDNQSAGGADAACVWETD